MSPIIDRLKREIRAAKDPSLRAELSACLAGSLARAGRFEESRQLLDDLRTNFGITGDSRVSVRIILAEGIRHYYGGCSLEALDRLSRAQLLAVGMRDDVTVAQASAWKAQLEFEVCAFDSMAKSLTLARSRAAPTNHDAWARLAILLSAAFEFCGDREQAQHWFIRAHEEAVSGGDLASIEALQHNRAAFRISTLFVEQCFGDIDAELRDRIRIEIGSAIGMQALTGVEVLTNEIELAKARYLILDGRYADAIDALRAVRDSPPFAIHNFRPELIDLTIGYCQFRCGYAEAALEVCAEVDDRALEQFDIDDRLTAAWMRWFLCLADSRFGDAATMQSQLDRARGAYVEQRRHLSEILAPFKLP
ncbi:MAG: hypothetical protein KGN16_08320 [Burkholderiales bacterium]|nr:hypothetical protein [Burkholderiales bacterium]